MGGTERNRARSQPSRRASLPESHWPEAEPGAQRRECDTGSDEATASGVRSSWAESIEAECPVGVERVVRLPHRRGIISGALAKRRCKAVNFEPKNDVLLDTSACCIVR